MQPPNTRRVLVSVAAAAERLGISDTEVRRRIRRGTLEAEKTERPQGTLLRVIFHEPEDTPPPANQPPETRQDAPAASLRDILEPLTEAHERLFEAYREIGELRERVGRAETRAEDATSRADSISSEVIGLRARLIDLERENAVRADALELAQAQLDEARAALEARQRADSRPWWKWWG